MTHHWYFSYFSWKFPLLHILTFSFQRFFCSKFFDSIFSHLFFFSIYFDAFFSRCFENQSRPRVIKIIFFISVLITPFFCCCSNCLVLLLHSQVSNKHKFSFGSTFVCAYFPVRRRKFLFLVFFSISKIFFASDLPHTDN